MSLGQYKHKKAQRRIMIFLIMLLILIIQIQRRLKSQGAPMFKAFFDSLQGTSNLQQSAPLSPTPKSPTISVE